jgi:hypothetical protein
MSRPLEGSRDIGDGIILSTCPDVCKTPVGAAIVPIPYSIWAKQNDTAVGVAETVHQTGLRSHKLGSEVTKCHNDEPGTAKGVKSGTVGDVCTPKTYSQTVRIEGKNAVRHQDEWWMNNRNTVGKLYFVRKTSSPGDPPETMNDAGPQGPGVSPDKPTQVAFNGAPTMDPPITTAPPTTPGSVPSVPGGGPQVPGPVGGPKIPGPTGGPKMPGGGGESLPPGLLEGWRDQRLGNQAVEDMPKLNDEFGYSFDPNNPADLADVKQFERDMEPEGFIGRGKYTEEQALERLRQRVAKRRAKRRAQEEGTTSVTRDKNRPCKVGPYDEINGTCGPDGQAHHIVPDYTLRYGTREEGIAGVNRIPGMPSFGDGPAICLQGQAGVPGSEHWDAHGVDTAIEAQGLKGNPVGSAPMGKIIPMSTNQAVSLRPECEKEIRDAVKDGFEGVDRTELGRATIDKPEPGSDLYKALSTGMRDGGRR